MASHTLLLGRILILDSTSLLPCHMTQPGRAQSGEANTVKNAQNASLGVIVAWTETRTVAYETLCRTGTVDLEALSRHIDNGFQQERSHYYWIAPTSFLEVAS